MRSELGDVGDRLQGQVRRHLLQTLGIAIGVGFLAALMMWR
ncbi:MAG: hypothetical protein QNJ43_09680 [Breoghania sp.]|nr:hypothetical protein [Breoghania sp.]